MIHILGMSLDIILQANHFELFTRLMNIENMLNIPDEICYITFSVKFRYYLNFKGDKIIIMIFYLRHFFDKFIREIIQSTIRTNIIQVIIYKIERIIKSMSVSFWIKGNSSTGQ